MLKYLILALLSLKTLWAGEPLSLWQKLPEELKLRLNYTLYSAPESVAKLSLASHSLQQEQEKLIHSLNTMHGYCNNFGQSLQNSLKPLDALRYGVLFEKIISNHIFSQPPTFSLKQVDSKSDKYALKSCIIFKMMKELDEGGSLIPYKFDSPEYNELKKLSVEGNTWASALLAINFIKLLNKTNLSRDISLWHDNNAFDILELTLKAVSYVTIDGKSDAYHYTALYQLLRSWTLYRKETGQPLCPVELKKILFVDAKRGGMGLMLLSGNAFEIFFKSKTCPPASDKNKKVCFLTMSFFEELKALPLMDRLKHIVEKYYDFSKMIENIIFYPPSDQSTKMTVRNHVLELITLTKTSALFFNDVVNRSNDPLLSFILYSTQFDEQYFNLMTLKHCIKTTFEKMFNSKDDCANWPLSYHYCLKRMTSIELDVLDKLKQERPLKNIDWVDLAYYSTKIAETCDVDSVRYGYFMQSLNATANMLKELKHAPRNSHDKITEIKIIYERVFHKLVDTPNTLKTMALKKDFEWSLKRLNNILSNPQPLPQSVN